MASRGYVRHITREAKLVFPSQTSDQQVCSVVRGCLIVRPGLKLLQEATLDDHRSGRSRANICSALLPPTICCSEVTSRALHGLRLLVRLAGGNTHAERWRIVMQALGVIVGDWRDVIVAGYKEVIVAAREHRSVKNSLLNASRKQSCIHRHQIRCDF